MVKQINHDRDTQVIEYLKVHTWTETMKQFTISRKTISNIRKRNGITTITPVPSQEKETIKKLKVFIAFLFDFFQAYSDKFGAISESESKELTQILEAIQ